MTKTNYTNIKTYSKNIKRYIVRKYVMALSVIDAVRKEKKVQIDDVWVDDDWKKDHMYYGTKEVGFRTKVCKKKK